MTCVSCWKGGNPVRPVKWGFGSWFLAVVVVCSLLLDSTLLFWFVLCFTLISWISPVLSSASAATFFFLYLDIQLYVIEARFSLSDLSACVSALGPLCVTRQWWVVCSSNAVHQLAGWVSDPNKCPVSAVNHRRFIWRVLEPLQVFKCQVRGCQGRDLKCY